MISHDLNWTGQGHTGGRRYGGGFQSPLHSDVHLTRCPCGAWATTEEATVHTAAGVVRKRYIRCKGPDWKPNKKEYQQSYNCCPVQTEIIEEVSPVPILSEETISRYRHLPLHGRQKMVASKAGVKPHIVNAVVNGRPVSESNVKAITTAVQSLAGEQGDEATQRHCQAKEAIDRWTYQRLAAEAGLEPAQVSALLFKYDTLPDPDLIDQVLAAAARLDEKEPVKDDKKPDKRATKTRQRPDSPVPTPEEITVYDPAPSPVENFLKQVSSTPAEPPKAPPPVENSSVSLAPEPSRRDRQQGFAFPVVSKPPNEWRCAEQLTDLLEHMLRTFGSKEASEFAGFAWRRAQARMEL